MPARVRVAQRIVPGIRKPVEPLRAARIRHHAIRADEASQPGVVISRVVVVQPEAALDALPGESVVRLGRAAC